MSRISDNGTGVMRSSESYRTEGGSLNNLGEPSGAAYTVLSEVVSFIVELSELFSQLLHPFSFDEADQPGTI